MPAVGDQYKGLDPNPFQHEESNPRSFTKKESELLQNRLEKQLGPEYISTRPGPGGTKLSYLEAYSAINLANEVFGFNGWSSTVKETVVDFVDPHSNGKFDMAMACIIRVTLKDGTFHEDVGFGHVENMKSKAAAFEKARKSAVTDGLKRALRQFGNLLGNCLYNKDYVTKIGKVKADPKKFDVDSLHRHGDFGQVKRETLPEPSKNVLSESTKNVSSDEQTSTVGADDEFGSDFDEADWAEMDNSVEDGPSTHQGTSSHQPNSAKYNQPPAAAGRVTSPTPNFQQNVKPLNGRAPPVPAVQRPPIHNTGNSRPLPQQIPNIARAPTLNLPAPVISTRQTPQNPPPTRPQSTVQQNVPTQLRPPPAALQQGPPTSKWVPPNLSKPITAPVPSNNAPNVDAEQSFSPTIMPDPTVGFFTARAAERLQQGPSTDADVPRFNLNAETPENSKRYSAIDHTKTQGVSREALSKTTPGPNTRNPPPRAGPGFNSPQTDLARRRIGAPVNMASPLSNRGHYKPPQMLKRPLDDTSRPALTDVTADSVNVPADQNAHDPKRLKTGAPPYARPGGNSFSS